jgi:hypothetical protein
VTRRRRRHEAQCDGMTDDNCDDHQWHRPKRRVAKYHSLILLIALDQRAVLDETNS